MVGQSLVSAGGAVGYSKLQLMKLSRSFGWNSTSAHISWMQLSASSCHCKEMPLLFAQFQRKSKQQVLDNLKSAGQMSWSPKVKEDLRRWPYRGDILCPRK